MSAANITLARSLYAAFGRGEIDTIVDACTPDIAWQMNGRKSDYPTLGTFKGRAGVREFFKLVADNQDAIEFAPRDFHASGDLVIVFGHYNWKIRKTGKTAASDWVHIFTVKSGKVTNFREFVDTARFAEAYRG